MSENPALELLLVELDAQREAYLDTLRRVELLVTQQRTTARTDDVVFASRVPIPPQSPPQPPTPRSVPDQIPLPERLTHLRHSSTGISTFQSSSNSRRTGEDSDSDNDESLYVQDILDSQQYELEDFRKHLQEYEWDDYGKQILETIVDSPSRMQWRYLFPVSQGPVDDQSHNTAYQIFDIGGDGAPVPVELVGNERDSSRAMAIWHTLKSVNPPSKGRAAVGRITVLREPSPILFAAAHFTTHKYFDTDELFRHLVQSEASSAHVHRAFDEDPRRQSSFVFSFEYFTIIGEDCRPMKWQLADTKQERKPGHIAITRCSAVVALALGGKPIRKLKNPARRARTLNGYAYDPWASWQVLNLQFFPDCISTTDTHDSTKHYVNGVEAFLVTLLSEYRDAEHRFEDIYEEISELVTPPLEFMFDPVLRDKLLFEDDSFTYSRRYFWAYQTLGIMIDSIRSLVDAYDDTFTDEVWEGKHKTLWPVLDENAPRNRYFRKRMASLKSKFAQQIARLNKLIDEHEARRSEIRALRDQLFSGTSVLESRRSVEMTEITVQQGHNIKLLTLVSIFFLPLTFVTSVFGMTNMPTEHHFTIFAIVTTTVCVPFFVLVGSLNSTRGMRFWITSSKAAMTTLGHAFTWVVKSAIRREQSKKERKKKQDEEEEEKRVEWEQTTALKDLRRGSVSTGAGARAGAGTRGVSFKSARSQIHQTRNEV